MPDAVATMEMPPVDKVLAILQTRCGCERTVEVPAPPPKTVTVELALLYKSAAKEERIFYLRAQGTLPNTNSGKGTVYLYQEGPAREQSRIVVPGMDPPKRLR
jgi:hypothetical protein